jgi:asparagine synthase (glutamine-hydrolysing)
MSTEERYRNTVNLFTPVELELLAPGLSCSKEAVWHQVYSNAPNSHPLSRACWTDIGTILPDDYLNLVDRTSMAHSLEIRVPYLDLDLATFGFSLPQQLKISRWKKKVLLRKLASEVLPKQISI